MYKESSLITTKLNIPIVSSKLIKRPRLFKKLDAYLKYKLVLINAPAGYGKTALITSWLSQRQKRKTIIAWLSLDEEDNDPELFWSYFLLSFYRSVEKENCLSSYRISEQFNRLQLTNLINSAANLDMDVIIVIEDFNVITNQKIIKDFKYLIKNMPLNMHILISSRGFIDLGLVKFRVSEDILEINENDLSFTLEETIEFFNKATNISLSKEKCKLINNETEGWVAAIQISALMMKNLDKNSFDKYIYRDRNFIFNYIAEEVFSNLHENIKKFLVLTSIFDQFSSEICNYVLNINNSREMIREILALNLFVISIDDEQKWFRYQNLFRSFLKSHLDDLGIEKIYELFNRIGEWYESKKQIRIAIENYIKGNNFKKASKLIQQISPQILHRGEANLLYKWNRMLPEFIVNTNPRLILNSAWGASSDGNKEKVNEYIRKVKELKYTDSKLKAEIAGLRSTNLIGIDDVDEIIEECKDVIKSLESKEFLAQLINLNVAIAYFSKGKLNEATCYFEKCFSIGIETNQLYIVVVAKVALNTLMRLRGKYSWIRDQNEKLISNLILKKKVLLPTIGLLYEQLAEVYYEWNELKKSLEYAKKGLSLGIDGGDIWAIAENYLVLAKIYDAMGLEEDSIASTEKAEEIIEDNNLSDIRLRLECYKAEIKLQKELENPISKRLDDIIRLKKVNLAIAYPDIYIVKVRYYINENLLIKAKEIVDMLRISAEGNGLMGLLIEVKILSSIICNKLGNEAKALRKLNSAINLSLKEKPIRVYLNKGNLMKGLLKKFKRKFINNISEEKNIYIDKLINSFKVNLKHNLMETTVPLKAREIEILKLIQDGASNSEISEELFISINTVKTHILNIYAKLDVHSRTKAVAKAKELNLIE
ncbi:LuxR C-terminal-related transcriptional regulator [Clostridium sp. AWRP]|uniref:LuxR C-terminal-related transcriptional regulator n=1 Tax=Clostridium sp. AWRP TaxID=2212991 RepID=UPI000FDA6082|nr:LuxR C-terminal-related transcriptional regulator [Clostridium sp. AWRP]AZV58553.1 LuxR family transcriptional regulator [Clostridium sp. AWRP]